MVKNSPPNARDAGLIPGSGPFPGEGNGNLFQYSCLGNSWTEEPGRLHSPWGGKIVRHDLATKIQKHTRYDPVIPLLAIYPRKKNRKCPHTNIIFYI